MLAHQSLLGLNKTSVFCVFWMPIKVTNIIKFQGLAPLSVSYWVRSKYGRFLVKSIKPPMQLKKFYLI